MAEDKASIMREFAKSLEDGDVEKSMSLFTEDPVYDTPYGPYKGKEAVRHLLTVMSKNMKDMKITESGNGIIVQGDKAFFEHVLSGTYQGKRYEMLGMCAYEFSGDKIKYLRTVYDRLLTAQQCVSGWPAKSIVNMVVKQSEKAMQ
jgi:ketosteroid isomerase-like protein